MILGVQGAAERPAIITSHGPTRKVGDIYEYDFGPADHTVVVQRGPVHCFMVGGGGNGGYDRGGGGGGGGIVYGWIPAGTHALHVPTWWEQGWTIISGILGAPPGGAGGSIVGNGADGGCGGGAGANATWQTIGGNPSVGYRGGNGYWDDWYRCSGGGGGMGGAGAGDGNRPDGGPGSYSSTLYGPWPGGSGYVFSAGGGGGDGTVDRGGVGLGYGGSGVGGNGAPPDGSVGGNAANYGCGGGGGSASPGNPTAGGAGGPGLCVMSYQT